MRSIYDDMRYVKVYMMTPFQIQAAKMHREFEGVKKREREEHTKKGKNPVDRNGRSTDKERNGRWCSEQWTGDAV